MTPLAALGPIPNTVVVLDVETFYSNEYKLKTLTVESYLRDPRFQVLGWGVRVLGPGARTVWLEEWEFRAWAARVDWSKVTVVANNAVFDCGVLAWHYGIHPALIVDTMAWGRLLHGEGALAKLAVRYGLREKGHDLALVKGLRREQISQALWARLGVYCRQDVDLTAGIFVRMAPEIPPLEWWVGDSTVRAFTEPRFVADQLVLQKAAQDERARKRALLERIARPGDGDPLERARATLSSSDQFAALLESMGEEPPTKLNKKGVETWAFAKTDNGMKALLEHPRDEIRFLAEARLAVKSTIIETRAERLAGIGRRGRVPMPIAYCKAHTHRWSGFDKINPQNFNRGGALRRALLAPPGHLVAVADSGQIEARVLPWLAGEEATLQIFRENDAASAAGQLEAQRLGLSEKAYWKAHGGEPDFYSRKGTMYFRRPITKEETPTERQTAKSMELGLGFGLGWGKFAQETLKGMLGAPPVQFRQRDVETFQVDVQAFLARPYGRSGPCGHEVRRLHSRGVRVSLEEWEIHCAVADYLVRTYRATNSKISGYWKRCDQILAIMERPQGDPREVRARFGPLEILRHAIRKPNGLVLRYPGLRKTAEGFVYQGGDGHREVKKTYGGSLTENIVQSLARDVVAEQAMWIRADGYPFATTTHDEVVCIVPTAEGPKALAQMIARMRVAPAWAPGLPLNAAGGLGENYGCAK